MPHDIQPNIKIAPIIGEINIAQWFDIADKARQHAKSARSNGNEAVILKEILDNKGIWAST